MDEKIAAALRAPFPPGKIGKKPKIWCRACSKALKEGGGTCGQNGHERKVCKVCKASITTAHLHLDYVGHADATDRLLSVDPTWNWEPVAFDAAGLPALDQHNGLWIRLTVAGLTRYGYGHPDGKAGGDAIKEAIGDAIRNAALRFGVALDQWLKERDAEVAPPGKQKEGDPEVVSLKRQIVSIGNAKGLTAIPLIEQDYQEWSRGQKLVEATANQLADYLGSLRRRPDGAA